MHLNLLGKQTDQIISELKKFKDSGITHLNLRWNDLGQKTGSELVVILSPLKDSGISYLDLRGNNLGQKTGTELVGILSTLKDSGISHLDLSGNGLMQKTEADLTLIFNAIPTNIATVSLTVQELQQMSPAQRHVLHTRFPNAEQIILVDGDNDDRKLNASLSRADANVYTSLGFKVSTPNLLNTASFFIARNQDKIGREAESTLPQELKERINQFRG